MSPDELRAARHRLGLTQKGLGQALYMGQHSWQTINAWEGGRKPIPADLHLKIAGLESLAANRSTNQTGGEQVSD